MKNFIITFSAICAAILLCAAGSGNFSPFKDSKGFIGGYFKGRNCEITNLTIYTAAGEAIAQFDDAGTFVMTDSSFTTRFSIDPVLNSIVLADSTGGTKLNIDSANDLQLYSPRAQSLRTTNTTLYGITTNAGLFWVGGMINTNHATGSWRIFTNGIITLGTTNNSTPTVKLDGNVPSISVSGWSTNSGTSGNTGHMLTNTSLATQFAVVTPDKIAVTNNTGKNVSITNGVIDASDQLFVRGAAAGTITLGAATSQNIPQMRAATDNSGIVFRGGGLNDFGIVLGSSHAITFSDDVGMTFSSGGRLGFSSAGGGSGWFTTQDTWFTRHAAGTIAVATNLVATNIVVNGGNLTLRTNAAPANTNTVVTWIPILGTNGQTYLVPGYQ